MRKLKIGHIGWLVEDHSDSYETVAWCDSNADKLNALQVKYPKITMYSDYREMLKHPELDVVVISTPNWLHCDMTCAFLEAGKHVFVEKPMGINREEIDRVRDTALRSGKNLAIDFEMRISPFARRIRDILESGELGELRRLEFIHHRGGWLEEGNGTWRTKPKKSGGLFLMEPIHALDIFRFLAGDVKALQSFAGPNVLTNYQVPDNACTHLFFANGAMGTFLTSHTLSAFTSDSNLWADLGHDMKMIITCTRGAISVDFLTARILINHYEAYPPDTQGTRVVFGRTEDYSKQGVGFFHDIELMRKDFLDRCCAGKPPLQDVGDAWKTHLTCLAAEESTASGGGRVEMNAFAESAFQQPGKL